MFCPNCGSEIIAKTKYCRVCGDSVQEIIELFVNWKTKKLVKFFDLTRSIIVILFAIVGLYLMARSVNLAQGIPLIPLLLVFLGLFSVLGLTILKNVFIRVSNSETVVNKHLAAKSTDKLLEEKPFEPISSVTEHSTELLYVEKKTRKIN